MPLSVEVGFTGSVALASAVLLEGPSADFNRVRISPGVVLLLVLLALGGTVPPDLVISEEQLGINSVRRVQPDSGHSFRLLPQLFGVQLLIV